MSGVERADHKARVARGGIAGTLGLWDFGMLGGRGKRKGRGVLSATGVEALSLFRFTVSSDGARLLVFVDGWGRHLLALFLSFPSFAACQQKPRTKGLMCNANLVGGDVHLGLRCRSRTGGGRGRGRSCGEGRLSQTQRLSLRAVRFTRVSG
jgi:hypothetical protein